MRRFEDRDAPMVMDLATDPYVPKIGTVPFRATEPQALEYIARQRRRLADGLGHSFCIATVSHDIAVGGVGLWLANLDQGRATAGWGIAPGARGRGFAAVALLALVQFGWTLPALHRIEAYIEPWNTASIRTAERAGFAYEGTLRSHQQIGDQRVDMQLYGLVRSNLDGDQQEERS